MSDDQRSSFRRLPARQRLALAIGLLSAFWTLWLLIFGGIETSIFGVRVRSHDLSRPAFLAVASLWIFARMQRRTLGMPIRRLRDIAAAAFRRWRTTDGLLLTAILGVAATARLWGLAFGLPHPAARPDEEAVASIAGSFSGGDFASPGFVYPPLFMLVVAATVWLVFTRLPAILARINVHPPIPELSIPSQRILARLLSAASGVASVWLLFRIATRLFGKIVGFTAAAFLALAFLHVRDSHFGVTDMPMVFMLLVAFLAIVKLSESGSRRDLVSAGLLTGLAIATKYNAGLIVLPAFFAILTDPHRATIRARLGGIVVFGVLMTAAFLVVFPHAVISHDRFIADVMFNRRHLAEGHGADLGRGWVYHLTTTLRHGLGVPLFAAGIVGLPLILWRERRRGVLVALFPLAYYLVMGSGRAVFARYALPMVPFLCLTAGYAVATAAKWMTSALDRPRWRVAVTSALTIAVLWPSVRSVVMFDRLIAREDTRVAARRWIEERFEPGTTIAQLGAMSGHVYIDYERRYVLSDTLSSSRPALIIIITSPISGTPDLTHARSWLEREYDLRFVRQVVAENDEANTYDRQDEFFVPLGGFHRVDAPGPNIRIFVRRDRSASLPETNVR
ncbi:MAG TPA: glycosyltransferase family 39 protein [Vicinamibacterales bacterium]|nr:glycosyltransferase family 39 protein [Vicinamibacterales bacterium]